MTDNMVNQLGTFLPYLCGDQEAHRILLFILCIVDGLMSIEVDRGR